MGRSGIPQISYHGEDAWQMPAGRASRQLGVFYHEESTEKDFYIAYNMHWLSHSFGTSIPFQNGRNGCVWQGQKKESWMKKKQFR